MIHLFNIQILRYQNPMKLGLLMKILQVCHISKHGLPYEINEEWFMRYILQFVKTGQYMYIVYAY